MKKKGFTLVELLGVIVLLAVIALIAVPLAMGVIEKAERGSFKDSVMNAFSQIEYYLVENDLVTIPEEGLDITKIGLKKGNFKYGEFQKNAKNKIEAVNVSDGKYCALGEMTNLQIFKGECDLTTPECKLVIEGEKGINGWYNNNPKVTMTTSEALTGGLIFGIGKEEIYNKKVDKGKVGTDEYQTTENVSEKVYCYVKNAGGSKGQNEINVQIDKSIPEEVDFSYTATSTSITVVARGKDSESEIVRYQFSKDGGTTWTEIQSSNTYTFKELLSGEYEVKVRVYNGTYVESKKDKNLYKESEVKTLSPVKLEAPTYKANETGWTGSVVVTIKYPTEGVKLFKTTVGVTSNVDAVSCSSVIGGAYTCEGAVTKTINAGIWYKVESNPEITFNENGSVIAQVVDGINYQSGSAMNISNIDKINPGVKASVSGKTATFTLTDNVGVTGYQVTTSAAIPASWISITSATSTTKTWTASSAGTYYVHVKDKFGNVNKVSFEIEKSSFNYEAIPKEVMCGGQVYTVYGSHYVHQCRKCGQSWTNSYLAGQSATVGANCNSHYNDHTVVQYTCPNGGTLNGKMCEF